MSPQLVHLNEDVSDGDLAGELEKLSPPMRLLTAEELSFDFFLESFDFPVVVRTEKGAICILPRPGYEPQAPQFCFGRWTAACRFPAVPIESMGQ